MFVIVKVLEDESFKHFSMLAANGTFVDDSLNKAVIFPSLALANSQKSVLEGLNPDDTFEVKEYWSDIGTIDQYAQSTFDLFSGKYNIAHTEIEKVADGLLLKGKSYVAPSSKIIGCNVIGDNSIIGKNVVLENCIIWDDVEIFDNVTLKNCIVASHSEIKIDMVNQIIGPNQVISKRFFS